MTHTCLVCGYAGLSHPPAQYMICPCCGTEFGYSDEEVTHEELRRRWVLSGTQWWSPNNPPPAGWSARRQLIDAGHTSEVDILAESLEFEAKSLLTV